MSARTKSALVAVLVALLAVATFLLQDGGGGGSDAPLARDSPSATASASASASTGVETGDRDPDSGLAWVLESDLPAEAVETLRLIDAGGPFPYAEKDGSTFGNFEGLLPPQRRGYYAEYTVETPGSRDRGARRIIAGDGGELYWTADHYESFARVFRPPGG